MLHLDQNHSTLSSPHSKPSVILSSTARTDQHSLRSWPAHDEKSLVQEQLDPPLGDQTTTSPVKPDIPAPNTETPTEPAASTGSNAPGNAEDPKVSDQSPSSPADATSPALESTSSLTPPPSTTSPAFSSVDLPDGETSEQQKVEGSEVEDKQKQDASAEAAEKPSRSSTPLSELSSTPEGDEPSTGDKKEAEDKKPGTDTGRPSASGATVGLKGSTSDSSNGDIKLNAIPTAYNFGNELMGAEQRLGQASVSRAQSIATPEPAMSISTATASPRKTDPKVDVMIELNAELLKVCMEFQARGIPLADPRAHQYAARLQSNLTWMATAADEHRKFSVHSMPLPPLQAPPPLDFATASVERIQQIYAELPAMFTKDIMRRQSATGAGPPNGNLKRERPDDAGADQLGAHKRRDTGESKASTPVPMSQIGHTSSPLQSTGSPAGQPGTPTHPINAPGMMSSSSSSPSMPPPSVPPGVSSTMNEAQIRARQMQMRQAAMQQGLGDAGRQMSAGGAQGGMGISNMTGASSIPPQQLAVLQQMGPGAVQCFQILQNPQHPLVQYMIQNVPGFQSAPLVQQIQQMQRVQVMMQAKSQQQRAANAQAGFPQGAGGAGAMGVPNGSPTRMSPSGQQNSMQQQGGFPFPGGSGGPSNTMGLTPAQQATLANMNPQQRQLFLLQHQQQQQMMRGSNAQNNAMMNQQMFNPAQQQRMPGTSPHIGSPMLGGPADGGNFPAALRSNPGVPGIARSARTPSDHAPSPMTPQISQGRGGQMDDFQRAMMAQRNMGQVGGMNQLGGANMNASWPQSQGMNNQGMSGAMSPPANASFGGMSAGGSPSIGGQRQWSPNTTGGQYPFNAGSPSSGLPGDISLSDSRQASATPAPMGGMAQNSPMPGGDQSGLNDFDIFDWTQ